MSKTSRTKGRSFEQAIARDLREWLGPKFTISRTPTDRQRDQAGVGYAGEFTIVGPFRFPFAIECKAQERFDYGQMFKREIAGPLPKFWAQAVKQAKRVSLQPMLIAKRNQGEVLVFAWRSDLVPLVMLNAEAPYAQIRLDEQLVGVVPWARLLEAPAESLRNLLALRRSPPPPPPRAAHAGSS